jgi:hypothetical protein
MTDTPEHHVVAALISEVRSKLEEAHSIAKAAEICARTGNVSRAVQILADFEGSGTKRRTCSGRPLQLSAACLTKPFNSKLP